jgi:hypothetical protein
MKMKARFALFLDYEIKSSFWAPLIGIPLLQEMAGAYFAWKTKRKVRRYEFWTDKMGHRQ